MESWLGRSWRPGILFNGGQFLAMTVASWSRGQLATQFRTHSDGWARCQSICLMYLSAAQCVEAWSQQHFIVSELILQLVECLLVLLCPSYCVWYLFMGHVRQWSCCGQEGWDKLSAVPSHPEECPHLFFPSWDFYLHYCSNLGFFQSNWTVSHNMF